MICSIVDNAIADVGDVRAFFHRLMHDEGASFHPDDSFFGMVEQATGERAYSDEAASSRDAAMVRCFAVCKECGEDIYEVALETLDGFRRTMMGELG